LRIEGVSAGPLRKVTGVQLRLEPVNVLFGPNGAGKSTILDALAGVYDRESPTATLYVRLSDGDAALVAELFRTVGAAHMVKRVLEELGTLQLGPDEMTARTRELIDELLPSQGHPVADLTAVDPSLRPARVVEAMTADLNHEAAARAAAFARALVAEPLIGVRGHRRWLSASSRDAERFGAPAVAASPSLAGSWLHGVAMRLVSAETEFIDLLDLAEPADDLLPAIVRLDGGPGDLGHEVEDLVPSLHDAHWGVRPHSDPELRWDRRGGTEALEEMDPWLDRDEDIGLVLRHSLEPVLTRLGRMATSLLPRFAQDEGTIQVRVRPVERWHNTGRRIDIVAVRGNRAWPIEKLAAGAQTWCRIALREACRLIRAQRPRAVMEVASGRIWKEDPTTEWEVVDVAIEEGVGDFIVDEWYEAPPAIVLADEPEAHLHPMAVIDVGTILIELAARNQTAAIATHAHQLLDLPTETIAAWRVVDHDGMTAVDEIGGDLLSELHRIGGDLGVRPSDILGLTRAVVFVEGKQDVAVLRGLFGRELALARVLLIPIHGTDNALATGDSELVGHLGLPIRTLFDNVRQSDYARGGRNNKEAKAVRALIERFGRSGVDFQPIAYEDPDIIAGLPLAAVRRVYPKVPAVSWGDAISAWRRAPAQNFKDFALAFLGLHGVSSTDFVEKVLQARLPNEGANAALARAVQELLSSVRPRFLDEVAT
jgi:energy-coupling factor transporter ATP-binding protein EcfA2